MKTIYMLFIIIIFQFSCDLFSQTWERIDGPYGANIQSLSYNQGIITLGTNSGIYSSSDDGLSWSVDDSSLYYNYSINKAIAISKNTFIYNIIDGREIKISNRPDLKTKYNFHVCKNGHVLISGYGIYNKNMELINNSMISFAYIVEANNYLFLKQHSGDAYFSFDFGQTFIQKHGNINIPATTIVDEKDNLYSYSKGITKSLDSGKTWQITGLTNATVHSLVYLGHGQFIAATNFGVMKSTDYCASWDLTSFLDKYIRHIVVTNHNSLIAVSDSINGVYRSTDNGESWSFVNHGLMNTDITNLYVKPDGSIIVNYNNKFMISNEQQNNWNILFISPIQNNFVVHSNIYYNEYNNKIYLQLNDNIYSTYKDVIYEHLFKATSNLEFYQDTIYRLRGAYFDRSIDTVKIISFGYSGELENYSFLFKNKNNIYFGSKTTSLAKYSISDGKLKFSPLNLSEHSSVTSFCASDNFDLLFTNKYSNKLYRSKDSGLTWYENIIGLPPGCVINDIIISNNLAYVATSAGIYKSDLSKNILFWTSIDNAKLNKTVNALYLDKKGYIYAGTKGGGIYKYKLDALDINLNGYSDSKECFTISPNPSTEKIQIKLKNNTDICKISISDLIGQEYILEFADYINISFLPKGIYILKIYTTNNEEYSQLFIKI